MDSVTVARFVGMIDSVRYNAESVSRILNFSSPDAAIEMRKIVSVCVAAQEKLAEQVNDANLGNCPHCGAPVKFRECRCPRCD